MDMNPMIFTMDSAAFSGFPYFPGFMGNPNQKIPGDSDYQNFHLPPFIQTERATMAGNSSISSESIRAFTIANKATSAVDQKDFTKAETMAFHSLSIDPSCIDGWRMLAKCLNPICDGDTIVCALREAINFAKKTYHKDFSKTPCQFYNFALTRPYIRLLTDLGTAALQAEQLDVGVYVYEEIIRLNRQDNTGSRNPLLACYMKLIGRIIRFPKTKPVRTIEQAQELINYVTDDTPLFEEDNLTVKWANILFAYAKKKKSWKDLAMAEYKRNPLMFHVVFNEIEINQIPPAQPLGYGYVVGDPNDDVRANGHLIKEAVKDWPEFTKECYRLIRGRLPAKVADEIEQLAPNPESELTKEYKQHMRGVGETFLEKGREALRKREFLQAVQNFTFAKRGYYEAAQPSRRFYLHAPFAIVSNRATGATFLTLWNLVRIDVRFTLEVQPDHQRSYAKLPDIAKAFNAKQLITEFEAIADDVQKNPTRPMNEWKKLARTCISLLSIQAIVLAANKKLTKSAREELLAMGIDDMYAPVNVSPELHPILPWLKETDIEPPIENK